MINIFNRQAKRQALKERLLMEYSIISVSCDFGSFQCILFRKAIEQLNEGVNPYIVKKWVDLLEITWKNFGGLDK